MQDHADIARIVITLAAKKADKPLEQVSEQSHFIDDLEFDSLDMMDFTMELEEEFELSVPDEEAQKLMTVGQVINFVMSRKQLAPAK